MLRYLFAGFMSVAMSSVAYADHDPELLQSMMPTWNPSLIMIDPFATGGPNPDARLIFLVDPAQVVLVQPFSSFLDDFGNCAGITGNASEAFPVVESQFTDFRDDLHVLHPPPYRICAADDIACINGP